MSLQDLEDMNILVDVDFSSDDELPDLSRNNFVVNFKFYVVRATCKVKNSSFVNFHILTMAKKKWTQR